MARDIEDVGGTRLDETYGKFRNNHPDWHNKWICAVLILGDLIGGRESLRDDVLRCSSRHWRCDQCRMYTGE
jgi:hypothetical protein